MRLVGDGERQVLHTVGLLQDRTELLLETNVCQASTELLKIDFEVLVVEELCIVQTGAHHTLVAVDNRFTHGRIGIRDDHKSAGELTLAS